MTAIVLAELVGATSSAISSYEKGVSTPSPAVFDRLSSILSFKKEFFFRPEEDRGWGAIFERSKAATTKSARKRAQHRLTWLDDILKYLQEFVRLPFVNLPTIPNQKGWFALSDQEIEEIASATRRYWKLGEGPISNITLLAENNGIVVAQMEMGNSKLDAFSTWAEYGKRPYIAFGTDGQSAFRTRFNVGHELGHLILHRDVTPKEFDSKLYFRMLEAQADRFASAFLTPASTFSMDITRPTLEVFRILKSKWRTSVKMMIHRAADLDIINNEESRRLYISYNRRRWNEAEPYDDSESTEKPRMVRRAFEALVDNEIIERSQIAVALPFNREDIEQLANLPDGYLREPNEEADVWDFLDDLTDRFPV